MLIREFVDHINEVDRRGFLRAAGAATVAAAGATMGNAAKARGWMNGINPHDPKNFIEITYHKKTGDVYYLKPDAINSGYFQYFNDSKIRLVYVLQKGPSGTFLWPVAVNPETKMYAFHNRDNTEWKKAQSGTIGGFIYDAVMQLPPSRGELSSIGFGKTPDNLLPQRPSRPQSPQSTPQQAQSTPQQAQRAPVQSQNAQVKPAERPSGSLLQKVIGDTEEMLRRETGR